VVDYKHLVDLENGGSEILSYQIQWDQGTQVWSELQDNYLS